MLRMVDKRCTVLRRHVLVALFSMKLNYTFNDYNMDVNIKVIHLSKVVRNVTFCSYFSFRLPTFTGCPAQPVIYRC